MAEFLEVMKQRERMHEHFYKDGEFMCDKCPIGSDKNGKQIGCTSFVLNYPQSAELIIMKWAEEHPPQTNADKFKEVFGLCVEVVNGIKQGDYWNQEYKGPKEV